MHSINAFFLYAVVSFPVFVCENPKPKPGFWPCPNPKCRFRKRCPGSESVSCRALGTGLRLGLRSGLGLGLRNWPNVQRVWPKAQCNWSNMQINQMCLTLIRWHFDNVSLQCCAKVGQYWLHSRTAHIRLLYWYNIGSILQYWPLLRQLGQCRTTVEYTKGAVGIQLGPVGYLVRLKPYMPYVCQYLYNVLLFADRLVNHSGVSYSPDENYLGSGWVHASV